MFLKIWRLITLILVALFMGLEFAHALELRAKMQYDVSLYVTIQNSLYQYFGAPGLGAFVTVGAVLGAISLTVLVYIAGYALLSDRFSVELFSAN